MTIPPVVLSSSEKIKQQILEATFPTALFKVTNPTDGSVDFEKIEETIAQKSDAFIAGVKIPSVPALPSISLIPKIPQLSIPSPAEIKAFILRQIEKNKREIQEQLLRAAIAAARKEDTPFSARRELLNRAKNRIQNSVLNGK
jgi:hypothetical protein